jgi:hypothetical protein
MTVPSLSGSVVWETHILQIERERERAYWGNTYPANREGERGRERESILGKEVVEKGSASTTNMQIASR